MENLPSGGTEDQRDDETQIIFASWKSYKRKISRMFRDINERKDAERKLHKLRQKGATTNYVAEFQQLLFWTD